MFILLYAVSSVLTFYKAKKKHHHALFQPHKCNHDICADFCAVSGQGCAVTYLEEELICCLLELEMSQLFTWALYEEQTDVLFCQNLLALILSYYCTRFDTLHQVYEHYRNFSKQCSDIVRVNPNRQWWMIHLSAHTSFHNSFI